MKSDRVYLEHILRCIARIEEYDVDEEDRGGRHHGGSLFDACSLAKGRGVTCSQHVRRRWFLRRWADSRGGSWRAHSSHPAHLAIDGQTVRAGRAWRLIGGTKRGEFASAGEPVVTDQRLRWHGFFD